MKYRKLGSTGLEVSAIGFGCWETGGEYGHFDEGQVVAAVERALELGVTLFDTALGYGWGRSERLLARALGKRRDDVVVVTKVGLIEARTEDGAYQRDSSRANLLKSTEDSLRHLGTSYVDLLLIHWPDRTRPFDEAMAALTEIQRSGKARYIGVSNFQADELEQCAGLAPLTTNQVGYNLFDRRWEHAMFETAARLGIGIMAYGPLAHGLLTGRMGRDTTFEAGDWRSSGRAFGQPLLAPDNLDRNLAVVEELKQIALDLETTLARLALAWVLRDPIVGVALTGVRTPEEIEDNVLAGELRLGDDTLRRIDQVMAGAAGQVAGPPR